MLKQHFSGLTVLPSAVYHPISMTPFLYLRPLRMLRFGHAQDRLIRTIVCLYNTRSY